jgi:hypothetical protein
MRLIFAKNAVPLWLPPNDGGERNTVIVPKKSASVSPGAVQFVALSED